MDEFAGQEMQERSAIPSILGAARPNRIGQHVERMMDQIWEEGNEGEVAVGHAEKGGG